ncbi:MAG: hypothetical protein DLM52_05050 [Chthoniobacterales bacterium]|nr:MAG: hypothetical protein DLM52_05050 [Chthoniobacterales bacterium]
MIRTPDTIYLRLHGRSRWYRHDYARATPRDFARALLQLGAWDAVREPIRAPFMASGVVSAASVAAMFRGQEGPDAIDARCLSPACRRCGGKSRNPPV